MPRHRVAVLSDHSLFAKGAAARLRQLSEDIEISELDPKNPHVLEQIAALGPKTVIIDAEDDELAGRISLNQLLNALPKLIVIQLDPKRDQIQVLTSERRKARTMDELVETIARQEGKT
jgi:hypothetical protein